MFNFFNKKKHNDNTVGSPRWCEITDIIKRWKNGEIPYTHLFHLSNFTKVVIYEDKDIEDELIKGQVYPIALCENGYMLWGNGKEFKFIVTRKFHIEQMKKEGYDTWIY